jgi:TRAP-type mannitol/chloroaromatic compound transport system substrate-binding protein
MRRAGLAGLATMGGTAALGACSVNPFDDTAPVAGPDSLDLPPTVANPVMEATPAGPAANNDPEIVWELPSSWVETLPTLWEANSFFAGRVSALTGGRFQVINRPAGEVAGPLEVLPRVQSGDFPAGTTASYYYMESSPITAFGTAIPFGLTTRQHFSWLYAGGGLELLQRHYAEKFNVIQFPLGSTGAQMGGWFTREVESLEDLRGLRMRIPGLGGQVMTSLGVETQVVGVGEIKAAFAEGSIDAAEFIGPDDDKNLGLQEAAAYYYYPGFWEPSAFGELQINLDDWNELPPQYQEALRSAAAETTTWTLALYDARNGNSLNDLLADGVEVRQFPDDVLAAAKAASGLLLDDIAASDPDFAEVLEQWRFFRRQVAPWFSLAEAAILR